MHPIRQLISVPTRIINHLLRITNGFINRRIRLMHQFISILGESPTDSLYGHIDSLINSFETWINSFVYTFESSTSEPTHSPHEPNHQHTHIQMSSRFILPTHRLTHRLIRPMSRVISVPVWIITQLIQFTHGLHTWLILVQYPHIDPLIDSLYTWINSSVYQFESSLNSFYLHIDSLLDSFHCTQLIGIP